MIMIIDKLLFSWLVVFFIYVIFGMISGKSPLAPPHKYIISSFVMVGGALVLALVWSVK